MHRKQPILSGGALLLSLFLISTTFLISTIPVTAQETSTVFRYDSPSVTTIASSFQVPVHQSASAASVRLLAPQIEIAPLSGVSGYPIGIFGADFGSSQGTVTILGQEATILEWTSTFVRAEIPAVSDGTGNITVTTVDNQSFSQPFEVYTINPNFQRAPTNRFTNIMRGKPAVVQNIDNNFCYQQPSGVYKEPTEFLTNFDCGFQGIIGDGEVVVTIPGGSSTVVAVDLEQPLSGDYYFQFYGYPSWYANWDIGPKTYTIQVSADSTDGVDGGWVTVHTENDNSRGIRLHKINIPDGGYRWIRMNISVGSKEPRVKLKELRLYESSNSASSDLDMVAIYGDSITEGAFYHIGATGLSLQMSSKIGSADEPIFTPFGLSGQNSTGLIEQSNIDYDIFDTFATDNVGNMARYWGIALGNNDTGFADNDLGVPGTNLEEFDERVEAMVQLMISQNKVPILARLPDTNENTGTDVLATKKKLLDDIDRIAADYRLIPGPDLYTLMRLNIERDNASWYWPGDAYHQNWEGRVRIIDAWAEAIVRGTNRTPVDPEVPFTPTPTPTDAAPPTNTPIPTATSTPLPTATNTPEPTATNTPEPTATNTPEPTATATSTAIPSTPTPTALPGTPIPTVTASPLATGDPTPTLSVTPTQPSSPTAQPTSLSPGGESGESSGSTTYLPIIGQ